MDEQLVLAVDLGTSGCKTALVSRSGTVLAWAYRPVTLHLLDGAGAEQVPEDWWQALLATAHEVLDKAGVSASRVAAVCCSTQGEGTIPVDREGIPLMNAITWMDMRGAASLRKQVRGWVNVAGYDPLKLARWLRLCGGAPALSGKDPAAHMLFIRDMYPQVYHNTYKFLNVLDYLNFRLTGRFVATHDSIQTSWVTDNRDVDRIRYNDKLLQASGIEADKFPELVPCTEVIGVLRADVANALGLRRGTAVVAGAIDNSAAAIGAGTLADGDAHLYLGTSSWIGAHVPQKKTDISAMIAAIPCAVPSKYLMMAMQTSAGNNLSFLKEKILYHQDELLNEEQLPDVYKIFDRIAAKVPAGSQGLLYAPWLYGERCPVEDRSLRGGLFNLSLDHTRETVIRAILEGVALNTRWMVDPVQRFLGRKLDCLTAVGGGATSNVWCQIFADVLGLPIRQLAEPMQANAIGAAYIAFVGLRQLDFATAAAQTRYRATYQPNHVHRNLYNDSFGAFTELHRRLAPLYQRLNHQGL
ncbi:xylulokinase [Duganella radicis]|uniref:Xylulose kinase n=1 Tax=Duganella radicis TaxID=551988 RepID=A0A6L6PRG3_9BURK|nr:FGGY-family carbohydrate kinase [Duganella radicis]MTV41227.1 xylulose kinase [Duganella radicis]